MLVIEALRQLTARPAIPNGNQGKGVGRSITWKEKKKEAFTVISSTKATSDDDGQFGNIHTCDRADHFGAVLGDPTFFCFGTDHVPSNVYEKEQRDLALRAQLDKMRRLECRRREQDPIIRYDTHGKAVNVCKTLEGPPREQV